MSGPSSDQHIPESALPPFNVKWKTALSLTLGGAVGSFSAKLVILLLNHEPLVFRWGTLVGTSVAFLAGSIIAQYLSWKKDLNATSEAERAT